MLTIQFTPLPKALLKGKKIRANAKPPSITKVAYIHEDFSAKDALVYVFSKTLEREDLLVDSWLYAGQAKEEIDPFSLRYTIPRSNLTNVSLNVRTRDEDYTEMIQQATKKGSPKIKLDIIENKALFSSPTYMYEV
jgi:hypothetical protein